MDDATGIIRTTRPLDFESQSEYRLIVEARNVGGVTNQNVPPHCACSDPSIVEVIIIVDNINDQPPVFDRQLYNACKSL